ncbi:hypothetical protein AB7M74_008712 [Bradyrhizobium japonicum]
MTKNVDAIRQLFGALNSRVGNLPSMPGIFPDYPAPIVRNAPDGRGIVMAQPFTSFSEFNKAEGGDIWFAFDATRRLLWTQQRNARRNSRPRAKTVDFKELLRIEPDSGTTNPQHE